MGIEDPDADAAEQRRLVIDLGDDDEELGRSSQPPLETDPADFAEQHQLAPLDEDDLYS